METVNLRRRAISRAFPLALFFLLSIQIVAVSSAELSVNPESSFSYGEAGMVNGKSLTITGEIDRETTDSAIKITSQFGVKHYILDSGGGDVEAAIKLGRYMRSKEIGASVKNACASSCILLYAGAVRRKGYLKNYVEDGGDDYEAEPSNIGVHRPFTISASSSTSRSSRDYERISSAVRQYLKEMNISESLVDQMNSTDPTSVKWLTNKEKWFYFPSADPVWFDIYLSSEATKLGITKKEYIVRRQRVKTECKVVRDQSLRRVNMNNLTDDELLEILGDKPYKECEKTIMKGNR